MLRTKPLTLDTIDSPAFAGPKNKVSLMAQLNRSGRRRRRPQEQNPSLPSAAALAKPARGAPSCITGIGVPPGGQATLTRLSRGDCGDQPRTAKGATSRQEIRPVRLSAPPRRGVAASASAADTEKEKILDTISANLEILASKAEEEGAAGNTPDLRAKIEETRTVLRTAQIDDYLERSVRQDLTLIPSETPDSTSDGKDKVNRPSSPDHDKDVFQAAASAAAREGICKNMKLM